MIQSWGTRADRQSVVPVGGPSNFALTAEALLAQSDTAPKLVVGADGDQTKVKPRIQRGLDNRGIKATILIVEPSLEFTLCILQPGFEQRQRRQVLVFDDQEILSCIQYTFGAAELPRQVDKLFSLLGIRIPET